MQGPAQATGVKKKAPSNVIFLENWYFKNNLANLNFHMYLKSQ
jgi:hypothetical protein